MFLPDCAGGVKPLKRGKTERLEEYSKTLTGTMESRTIQRVEGFMILRMMEKEVDGVFVLTLDGRIVLGEESHFFREKLKDLTDEGKKKIVLNMANINYIDSAGLGTLVAAHFSAKNKGASIRLCHLDRNFHDIMQMTKILTIFDVYDTEAAAINSF